MTVLNPRTTTALLLTSAGVLLVLSFPFPTITTGPKPVEYETLIMTSTTIAKGVGPEILTMEVAYGWMHVLTSQTTLTLTKYASIAEAGTGTQSATYILFSLAIILTASCLLVWHRSRGGLLRGVRRKT